jgi:hypothetical protein
MTERDPDTVIRELNASLGQLLEQVYQMQGLFNDDDETIQRAVDDAQNAEDMAREYLKQ